MSSINAAWILQAVHTERRTFRRRPRSCPAAASEVFPWGWGWINPGRSFVRKRCTELRFRPSGSPRRWCPCTHWPKSRWPWRIGRTSLLQNPSRHQQRRPRRRGTRPPAASSRLLLTEQIWIKWIQVIPSSFIFPFVGFRYWTPNMGMYTIAQHLPGCTFGDTILGKSYCRGTGYCPVRVGLPILADPEASHKIAPGGVESWLLFGISRIHHGTGAHRSHTERRQFYDVEVKGWKKIILHFKLLE